MGREIRRVPPNWEHPKDDDGHYHPMYDKDFDTAFDEWGKQYRLWRAGKHPSQEKYDDTPQHFWEWDGGPPNPETHRPAFIEEPTWYQMYEDVSEGTPVTPPFASKEELVNYLVKHGTFWDKRGWDRENAEGFVRRGWAPSMMMTRTAQGITDIREPRDGMPEE